MGVQGLWNILDSIQQEASVRSLGGQSLSIDLSGWICEDIHVNKKAQIGIKLYIRNMIFRIITLLKEAVIPVIVTDGKAPAIKATVMRKRNKIQIKAKQSPTEHEKNNLKKPTSLYRPQLARISSNCCLILKALGVPCVQSPGEAEAMCAFLNSENLVDGCVSNDGDCFLYGAKVVYRHFSMNSRNPSVSVYRSNLIENQLGIDRERLVLLGLLLGCDYWPTGTPGVGKVSALELLSRMDVSHAFKLLTCTHIVDSTNRLAPRIESESVWTSSSWKKVLKGLSDCPVNEILEEFLMPYKARGWKLPNKEFLQLSQPDIKKAVDLCELYLNWEPTYSLVHFIPLLAQWIVRHCNNLVNDKNIDVYNNSYSHETYPLKIIRKRTVNYVPCYEIEWKRLESDIWSEDALINNQKSLINLATSFFTPNGYRFSLPVSEFRTAFSQMVTIFEFPGLELITNGLEKFKISTCNQTDDVINSQKGSDLERSSLQNKNNQLPTHESQVMTVSIPTFKPSSKCSSKSDQLTYLPIWDSPIKMICTHHLAPSIAESYPVEDSEFLKFENNATIKSRFPRTPPSVQHSDTDCDFSFLFPTPEKLFNRLNFT